VAEDCGVSGRPQAGVAGTVSGRAQGRDEPSPAADAGELPDSPPAGTAVRALKGGAGEKRVEPNAAPLDTGRTVGLGGVELGRAVTTGLTARGWLRPGAGLGEELEAAVVTGDAEGALDTVTPGAWWGPLDPSVPLTIVLAAGVAGVWSCPPEPPELAKPPDLARSPPAAASATELRRRSRLARLAAMDWDTRLRPTPGPLESVLVGDVVWDGVDVWPLRVSVTAPGTSGTAAGLLTGILLSAERQTYPTVAEPLAIGAPAQRASKELISDSSGWGPPVTAAANRSVACLTGR
jgi:hypothetical protein